ncbi:PilZ domain-containing protein [Blastococcus sp. SYSU DS0510]
MCAGADLRGPEVGVSALPRRRATGGPPIGGTRHGEVRFPQVAAPASARGPGRPLLGERVRGALPPARASITIDEDTVDVQGQIVRQQVQGRRWLLSVQFRELSEQDATVLRRRVFRALREERAAAVDRSPP